MLDKKALLQEQIEGSSKRDKKLKPVKQSFATGQAYSVTLRRMVRQMRKDINELLVPVVRRLAPDYQRDAQQAPDYQRDAQQVPDYQRDAQLTTVDAYLDQIAAVFRALAARWRSSEFDMLAYRVASEFVNTADRVNRRKFDQNMKSFGINVFADNPALTEFLQTAAYDNARLIKSIPEQYLTQVESIVMTNVRSGNRSSAITKQLAQQFGVTDRRAKFIARDQTAKINGELVKKRQVAVGFEYFQWVTSDDERVRDRHDDIANKVTAYGRGIYRWDRPPISEDGQPIIPGQDYGCRCVARPVSQAEVDANVKAGRTRPGVLR